jgi:hypothetical protein
MTNQWAQPTVLVKKADGTQVRLTMAEFVLYKKGNKEINSPVVSGIPLQGENNEIRNSEIEHKESENLPATEGPVALSTAAPVKEIFVDEAAYEEEEKRGEEPETGENKDFGQRPANSEQFKINNQPPVIKNQRPAMSSPQLTKEDFQSLLEEADEPMIKKQPVAAIFDIKPEEWRAIEEKAGAMIPREHQARFTALVASRIKNIRSDDQLVDYFGKPAQLGGLGLGNVQAEKLGEAVRSIFHLNVPEKRKEIRQTASFLKKFKRSRPPEDAPQASVETWPGVENGESFSPPALAALKPEVVARHAPNWQANEARPIIKDVVSAPIPSPVKKESPSRLGPSIDPVEEILTFSYEDWRRLSLDAERAGELLLEKLNVLKSESFLLFVKAREAWFKSPLFQEYEAIIRQALLADKSTMAALDMGNRLKRKDFSEIIKINRELAY